MLVAGGDDDAPAVLSGWLSGVADSLRSWAAGGSRPTYDHSVAAPLFQQLVQSAAQTVSRGQAEATARALERLRDHLDDHGAAGLRDVERLMRATLGLAMYRADAWLTSIASRRLAEQRTKRRTGLQVGGYGWLVRVRQRTGRASQGHIHAPSLDHATTAAVLRSGWAAFGTQEAGSPLAINLSGERVRAARSLIEGVRSGQTLGRLLGANFERRLHDRHLDAHIDDVPVRGPRGAGWAPPHRPGWPTGCAGPCIHRGDRAHPARGRRARRARTGDLGIGGPGRAVDGTPADLDAVSDVLMAQAVHSLLRGDAGVAAPTLAATGSGDSGLPALDAGHATGRPAGHCAGHGGAGSRCCRAGWPGADAACSLPSSPGWSAGQARSWATRGISSSGCGAHAAADRPGGPGHRRPRRRLRHRRAR